MIIYCSKCGQLMLWPLKMKQIDEYNGLLIYGTQCCGAGTFDDTRVRWDYIERQVPDGYERIVHSSIALLIKICCAIGKSPFSIRRGVVGDLVKKHFYDFWTSVQKS